VSTAASPGSLVPSTHTHRNGGAGGRDEGAGGERLERQLVVALGGGVLLLTSWIASLIGYEDAVAQIPAAIGAIVLVLPLARGAWQELRSGTASSDSLACLAVLAALANNYFLAAGFLAFFLWLAELILSRTAWGAQRAIRDLVELTPDVARLVTDAGEREVSQGELRVGQVVRVRPGENLPADGRIVAGTSNINQASLTGEAVPVEVQLGSEVYAGTTNLTGQIDLEVTAVAGQTTIGKVEQLIREAERSRTRRQELIERLASYYVPVVLMVALVVWFFTSRSTDAVVRDSAAERAITVLVVTCPGALLIAYPTAMVAAFAAAARLGIMIKQTRTLEAAAEVDTVVLDKTGTITTGRFAVSRLVPAEGVEGAALLQAAADAEPRPLQGVEEVHGRGVSASIADGGTVLAGRGSWIAERHPETAAAVQAVEEKIDGMSSVHVHEDGRYLGAVGLEDKLRRHAGEAISSMRDLGVRRVSIFTGDRLSVAVRVGRAVGVDAVEAECLPEEKHEQLQHLIRRGNRTLVVGDGINDGPILASADVGVAMGLSGSDIATNSAGVALMNDDLRHVPFLIELARRSRGVIAQNIGASLLLALVGLALAASGQIQIWVTPFYQAVAYIFVIANSLRLVRFGEDFAGAEEYRRAEEARRAARPTRAASRRIAPTG